MPIVLDKASAHQHSSCAHASGGSILRFLVENFLKKVHNFAGSKRKTGKFSTEPVAEKGKGGGIGEATAKAVLWAAMGSYRHVAL